MGYHVTMVLWATAAAMAVALEPADVQVKDSVNVSTATRGKRTLELFSPLSRSYGSADSRISTGPTASSRVAISTHYFDRGTPPITIRHQTRAPTHHSGTPIRRQRPHTVPAPPYAVQMEPLVQYSQRDPLYHQQQKQALSGKASEQSSFNDLQHVKKTSGTPELQVDYLHKSQHVSSNELSSANTVPPSNEDSLIQTSKNDHELAESNQIPRGSNPSTLLDSEPQAGHLSSEHLYPYDDSSYYLREPEPIIEIIVKESNESLPPSPTQPSPPPRSPTKEPVQVFYVKYKKDPAKYGKDGGIVYDPPVPAVTPASNSDTEEHYPLPSEDSSNQPTLPPLPPQTTTLRTIIRPDSETYHGTGLHVTFGDPHDEDSHDDYQQQSAPHPSVVFPHQNFGPRYQHRPTFVPHEQHKRQQELFQQQPPTPFLHPQPQFHQQQGHLSPHPSSFQRPFNSPPFPQQRQPQFQQPPPLSQQPPFPHQPPQFRHSPPQPPQQQQPQLSNQQPYQKPPFQFQQRPLQQPGPHNQHRYPPQIQQSQQVLLPQRPSFQEHLQRPSLQQPQNIQQRPHFAQSPLTLDQRKPVFPLHPGSGFVQQPDQQQNNPQSPVGVQQQQHLLQQQRQQQLLQLQQQQRQHSQQLQQFPVQQQQHLFTHPQQQSVPVKQQSHLGADIVKSVSQQLHLTPNSQSNQQPLLTSNNKFQQQPSPTQSALFQQPLFSQQTPTRQQPQSVLPTPAINNYSVPPKSISSVPSSTNAPTTVTTPKQHEIKTEVSGDKDKNAVNPSVLASLPDEVPDDLRQQLLSSGILSNADIQILDYDKVGDIPIENLPPEALENFYGAAGAASDPVPSIVSANDSDVPVEMKVVRFNPATAEGQELAEKYVREGATQVDPVVLNDSKYNRYLPLKLSGAQFPLPDVPELRGRNVTSVVVLAPVDYDFQQKQVGPPDDDTDRSSRETKVQVHGVQFVAGEALKELVKEPTFENFKRWLDKENSTVAARQSIVLLVAGSTDGSNTKDIFMYDVGTQKVSSLRGELSSAFVEVAESNANSQELDSLAAASDLMDQWEQSRFELQSGDEPSAAASDIFEDRVLPNQVVDISSSASEQDLRYDETKKDKKSVIPHYLTFAVSESDGESKDDKTSNMILVSSGYSKTSDFTGPSL
ncbi:uncharacterized protein LOC110829079 isoform X1 [Zootermopsis nevadensis]|uniref:uncharacterized protein LOC110829079 isoform X1 n=1 Tax=Zootermopsis nevadensis TaxID=136037 RepID=UPI000B8EDC3E|nr:uncharacterized protein LOC110829079 isoform X1 [Zootermopsis nevadensis]